MFWEQVRGERTGAAGAATPGWGVNCRTLIFGHSVERMGRLVPPEGLEPPTP